jgi:hypothetical protein
MKSKTLPALFDDLDLASKTLFQRLILLSARSSLRAAFVALMAGVADTRTM